MQPFGETVEQVFARLSAMRDKFDGPPVREFNGSLWLCWY